MAILITGLQGSGKSYKAVYTIYYDRKKYSKIFTDIDGFKNFDNARFQNFSGLIKILEECYNSNVIEDKPFSDSIEILKKFGILDNEASKEKRTLIVVDEAQNHFGTAKKLSEVLLWFITQHRHLYIELILLTQKYNLLRSQYLIFNEFYEAVPPIKKISNKKFSYYFYASVPPNDKSYISTVSIPIEEKIFKLYQSGDKVVNPNPFKRFIFMFLIALVLLLGSLFYFFGTFGKETETEKAKKITETEIKYIGDDKKEVDSSLKVYRAVLWKEDDYFYIVGYNSAFDMLPTKLFNIVKKRYDFKILYSEDLEYRVLLWFEADERFLNFLGLEKEDKEILRTNVQNYNYIPKVSN